MISAWNDFHASNGQNAFCEREVCPGMKLCLVPLNKAAFLVMDNRVLKGPLGRLLRSFTTLASRAHSVHRLAHSLRSQDS